MRLSKLQKEILKTLLFFNLQKRPLTSKEIYEYLGMQAQEGQVFLALVDLCRKKKIIEKNQYFVLKKYQNLFRALNQGLKIRQALKAKVSRKIWLLKLLPFARSILLANSLTMGLPNKNSDIDLIILTKKNRLWTTRFFANGILTIFGLKRARDVKKAPGKFCLSYFIDLSEANLKNWRLIDDPLMDYWLATLEPLMGIRAYDFFMVQNDWLFKNFPNLKIEVNLLQKIKPLSFGAFIWEKTMSLLGDKLEKYLFEKQSQHIQAKNQPDTIIATRKLCKVLQPDNFRANFTKEFQKQSKHLIK